MPSGSAGTVKVALAEPSDAAMTVPSTLSGGCTPNSTVEPGANRPTPVMALTDCPGVTVVSVSEPVVVSGGDAVGRTPVQSAAVCA